MTSAPAQAPVLMAHPVRAASAQALAQVSAITAPIAHLLISLTAGCMVLSGALLAIGRLGVGSGTGAVASGAPFPAPARQTVHALLAHTAYRHRSPIGVRSHPVYISGETEYPETAEPVAVMAFAPPTARDISLAIVEYC